MSNIQQFYDIPKIQKIVGIISRDNPYFGISRAPELLNKFYDLKYDVIIDEGENSPTARIASVQSAKELLQYAQAMPPSAVMTIVKAVVDMSDFPGKTQMIQQLTAAAEGVQVQEIMKQVDAATGQGENKPS